MANITGWNANEPLDTHHVRFGAEEIRKAKTTLQNVISDEHEWGAEEAGAHSLGSARTYVGTTAELDALKVSAEDEPLKGRIFFDTQREVVEVFVSYDAIEAAWVTQAITDSISHGTLDNRPNPPENPNRLYWTTDTRELFISVGEPGSLTWETVVHNATAGEEFVVGDMRTVNLTANTTDQDVLFELVADSENVIGNASDVYIRQVRLSILRGEDPPNLFYGSGSDFSNGASVFGRLRYITRNNDGKWYALTRWNNSDTESKVVGYRLQVTFVRR